MRRWVFNLAAGLSLVFWLVTLVLWVRSYDHSDFVQFASKPTLMVVTSPEQAAAWERMRVEQGWDGLYTFHYCATSFNRGTWVFSGD